MNLEEAKEKKKLATKRIGEFIASNFSSSDNNPWDISRLPGIGICPTSKKGKFAISLHIANRGDQLRVRPLMKELKLTKDLVDVQVTGIASAWTNHYHRPLANGLSISHCGTNQLTSGTLGCFVRKRSRPNELLILSCAHVLLPTQYPNIEIELDESNCIHKILQPAICDGGKIESHYVAHLKEYIPLSFSNPENEDSYDEDLDEEPIDAAVAAISSSLNQDCLTNICNLLNGKYRTSEEIFDITSKAKPEDFPIFKIGKKTKLTSGKIRGLGLERYLTYDEFTYKGMPARCQYTSLIAIEGIGKKPFSRPGDSGSLIFDEEGYAIALLVGGTMIGGYNKQGITYALPIDIILDRLELELVTKV